MQATVRNAAHADEPFAAEVDGAAGNRVEYALAAVNIGRGTLSDVAIAFAAPPVLGWDARHRQLPGAATGRGLRQVPGPAARRTTCRPSAWRRARSSKCASPTPSTRRRAGRRRSPRRRPLTAPQTPITSPAITTVSYTGVSGRLPRCGTKLAQLLTAVPAATRATCAEWPGLEQPVLARVQCAPKRGARYAVYIQYRTPAVTAQVFELIAGRETPRSCGAFTDGTGTVQDTGGKRVVQCSSSAGGVARVTWYDDDASVFAYADGGDADRDALLAWWRANG